MDFFLWERRINMSAWKSGLLLIIGILFSLSLFSDAVCAGRQTTSDPKKITAATRESKKAKDSWLDKKKRSWQERKLERDIKKLEQDRKKFEEQRRELLKRKTTTVKNPLLEKSYAPTGELLYDGKKAAKEEQNPPEQPYRPEPRREATETIRPEPATEQPSAEPKETRVRPATDTPVKPVIEKPKVEKLITAKTFRIPYVVNLPGNVQVKKTTLWITKDGGAEWAMHTTDLKNLGFFNVVVEQDGTYGFKTQAEDQLGNSEPTPKAGDQPMLSVTVDTAPPMVRFLLGDDTEKQYIGNKDNIMLKWSVNDTNLDEARSLLQVRKIGGPWTILDKNFPVSNGNGSHLWKIPDDKTAGAYQFRLTVYDRAGFYSFCNSCVYIRDAEAPLCQLTCKSVNASIVTLNYEVSDDTEVKPESITLYYTTVGSGTWTKYHGDFGKQKIEFKADKETTYGFYLFAADIVGNNNSLPDINTKPMCSITIDFGPPEVKLLSFTKSDQVFGPKKETIKWAATDSNFGATPITIILNVGGLAQETVAKNLPNSGEYVWDLSRPPYLGKEFQDCRLVVIATDLAGKTSKAVSEKFSIVCKIPVSRMEIPVAPGKKQPAPESKIILPTPNKIEPPVKKIPESKVEKTPVVPRSRIELVEPLKKGPEPKAPEKKVFPFKVEKPAEEIPRPVIKTTPPPEKTAETKSAENTLTPSRTIEPFTLKQIKSTHADAKGYYNNGRFDLAINALRILITHYSPEADKDCAADPEIAEAHYLMGNALQRTDKDADEYIPYFEKFLEYAPRDKTGFNKIGRLKDYDYTKFETWIAQHKEAAKIVGNYYYMKDQSKRALGYYEQAASFKPALASEIYAIGVTLFRLDDKKKAQQYMKRALEKADFEAKVLRNSEKQKLKDNQTLKAKCSWYIARIYDDTGKYAEARDWWHKAAKSFEEGSRWQMEAIRNAQKAEDSMVIDNRRK